MDDWADEASEVLEVLEVVTQLYREIDSDTPCGEGCVYCRRKELVGEAMQALLKASLV